MGLIYMDLGKIKSEIIYEYLFKQIQNISKEYKDYLKVSMGDMYLENNDDDYVMDIFIDCVYDNDDFNNEDMYVLYLNDFVSVCDKFIKEIDENLVNHLWFSDEWCNKIVGYDKIYYSSKLLCFRVIGDE